MSVKFGSTGEEGKPKHGGINLRMLFKCLSHPLALVAFFCGLVEMWLGGGEGNAAWKPSIMVIRQTLFDLQLNVKKIFRSQCYSKW